MFDNLAKNASPSQEFVPIKEVRDGVLVLKNDSLRAILMTSSVNFALKGEDERAGYIFQFQNFLNSLDFSVQIYVQSRDLDIRPYIAALEEAYEKQTDDLMRIQIREYITFIKRFVESANIMTKQFFVVVPFDPIVLDIGKSKNIFSGLFKSKKDVDIKKDFEEDLSQLEQRVAIVQQGLIRMGIRSVQLDTEEVIELFYKIFNPGERDMPDAMLGARL